MILRRFYQKTVLEYTHFKMVFQRIVLECVFFFKKKFIYIIVPYEL